MKYIYSNNLGEEFIYENSEDLRAVLEKSYEYWQEGTGDTSIHINDNERLIFFKIEQGVFIMQHPDYLAPKINNDPVIVYEHFIGGQEFIIPSTCLCDEDQAFDILNSYIENEELPSTYTWIDFYDEIEGFEG